MDSGRSVIAASVSAALALCAGPARAADPAIDRAVESILDRPLVLEEPAGFEAPSPEAARKLLDDTGVDLEKLSAEAQRIQQEFANSIEGQAGPAAADATHPKARLLVFVSLSMPEASLRRVVADAERAGAMVVMNGMHQNSMRATKTSVQSLTGERPVGWQIDPVSRRRFGVTVAPTTVLAANPVRRADCDDQREGVCIDEPYWGFEGDVSLDYALERIIAAAPEAGEAAAPYLARLRERQGGK